jgi:RNA-directed DNA polymerase
MTKPLDECLLDNFTEENVKTCFRDFKNSKYDVFIKEVKIQMGVDGITWETFEKELENNSNHICKRVKNGKYLFSPFREVEISKNPELTLVQAKVKKETRTLSIATIKDTLVQKIIYNTIIDFSEKKFKSINYNDSISFAYRRDKSAPKAARFIFNHLKKGIYSFAIDADISKFFDSIPHSNLITAITNFFGNENTILIKYLTRFIKTDKCEFETYKKNLKKFFTTKPIRTKRIKGIPQGGVLSGLIANIYMHDFDQWLIENYKKQVVYVRYADDFIILFKEEAEINNIFEAIDYRLKNMGLTIHPIGSKTKKIELRKESIIFVGFEISKKFIRVKNENIKKFKTRLLNSLKGIRYLGDLHKYFRSIINIVNFKLLGNEGFKKTCELCEKEFPIRSWLKFFLYITDVRQLKNLDLWIRKIILKKVYKETNFQVTLKMLNEKGMNSFVKLYYRYKKLNNSLTENCECRLF